RAVSAWRAVVSVMGLTIRNERPTGQSLVQQLRGRTEIADRSVRIDSVYKVLRHDEMRYERLTRDGEEDVGVLGHIVDDGDVEVLDRPLATRRVRGRPELEDGLVQLPLLENAQAIARDRPPHVASERIWRMRGGRGDRVHAPDSSLG